LSIGETKDLKSLSNEESIAALVSPLTLDEIVTLAVEFDDQLR